MKVLKEAADWLEDWIVAHTIPWWFPMCIAVLSMIVSGLSIYLRIAT